MRHLSTEELLLQCDGELGLEWSSHLAECAVCRARLVDLEARLYEIEHQFRDAAPAEPIENRIASWVALEQKLHPPRQVSGFPLRWPAVYAAAAALTFAVLAGYLSSVQTPPEGRVELAQRATLPAAAELKAPAPEPSAPFSAAESVPLEVSPAPRAEARRAAAPPLVSEPIRQPQSGNADSATAPVRPVRFEMMAPPRPLQAKVTLAAFPPPSITVGPPAAPVTLRYETVFSAPPVLAPEPPPSRPAPAEASEAMIDGYWMLLRANAWREDIEPVWGADGLRFKGSVESSAAKRRIEAALIEEAGSRRIAFDLRVRSRAAAPLLAGAGATAMLAAVDRRPAGGAVRHTLLAHFSDAARRSFQSAQPSVLEAELDRFVSDVFRSQSQLLSHVYAVKRLLSVGDGNPAALAPAARKKLVEMTRFHVDVIGEQQARIYDRLSETLPRRFWSYRPSERNLVSEGDWRTEGASLLRDTLQLDFALTALLSTPQPTIDASDPNLSCGELLHRIRTRVRHLRADADALR